MPKELTPRRFAPARRKMDEVTLFSAEILFRNFTGLEKQFNKPGDRNFVIVLDDETAEMMREQGWNVKSLKPREEDEEGRPYIQVAVSYKYEARAPRIILLTSKGRTPLTEDMVTMLDYVDIFNVDVTLNPSQYDVNGNKGVKAYLKTMYIKIVEDPLDLKYADYEETLLELDGDEIIDAEIIDDYETKAIDG